MNKHVKRIFLGLFLFIGTVIILLAGTVIMNFIMADNVDSKALTRNIDEFSTLYDEFANQRDLPQGLMVADARCRLNEDTYTVTVRLKNVTGVPKNISLQLYFGDGMAKIKSDISKPFLSVTEEEGMIIPAGQEKEFTYTGSFNSSVSSEDMEETMDMIRLEVLYANKVGRIMLPVVFSEN